MDILLIYTANIAICPLVRLILGKPNFNKRNQMTLHFPHIFDKQRFSYIVILLLYVLYVCIDNYNMWSSTSYKLFIFDQINV